MLNRRRVPAVDRVGIGRDEGDVRAGGHAIAAGHAADGVQDEVVVLAAAEEDVRIAVELSVAQHGEAELDQRRLVQAPACRQVADPDADVVDDLAHARAL